MVHAPKEQETIPVFLACSSVTYHPTFRCRTPAVIAALRAAFLIETQPLAVVAYLRFLSTCALGETIQEQADLSLVNNYIVTFFISEKICNYCGFVITGSCPGNCRA